MEFIDAWKEAQKLGLTKEEFLPNWKNQLEVERLRIEAQMYGFRLQQNTHSDNNGDVNTKLQDLGGDYLEGVENRINVKFQEVQDHITREINSHKQQLMQQALTKDEFREQFQSLTDLLSNSMHSISLKMEQKTQETSSKRETEISFVNASSTEKMNKISVQESVVSEDSDINTGRRVHMLQQQNEFGLTHKTQRDADVLSSQEPLKESSPFFNGEGAKTNDGAEPVEEEWNLVGSNGKIIKSSALNPKTHAFSPRYDALSQNESLNGPITGEHVKAISPMMALRNEGRSVNIIPKAGAIFEINCAQLPKSGIDFYSDIYYSLPTPCKVRIRILFNETGRLCIQALLYNGIFDENHKWPITFTGTGCIYNYSSRTFTKLWFIDPLECNRPTENNEISLDTTVCLWTSRNNYQNVTYSMLETKKYTDNKGNFRFNWNFMGFENKN